MASEKQMWSSLFNASADNLNDESKWMTTFGKGLNTGIDQNLTENTTPYYYTEEYPEYTEYIYPGFPFEKPIYLYVWEFLVIFVSIVNIFVIIVLMRKGMRNATNMILTFIAVADSLTGLITLPSYIMVYSNFMPAVAPHDYSYVTGEMQQGHEYNAPTNYYQDYASRMKNISDLYADNFTYNSGGHYEVHEGYLLTKELCRAFMISKFFVSKSFHTMSIFLTLFLGFQRYVSVAFPFKTQSFFTVKKTVIVCLIIFAVSPIIHVYHLIKEKAVEGMCEWRIDTCDTDCAYLWFILFFRHLIPCTCLTVFTVLFIRELRKGRIEMNQEQSRRRAEENRRVSIIVTAIVVVFLVPEIPYGFFLLSSVVRKHAEVAFDLEANRAIHAVYELSLVLSFHANFYIYTFLNKRFRSGLKRTFLYPIRRAMGKPARWALSKSMSFPSGSNKKTMESDFISKTGTDMRMVMLNTSENSQSTLETKADAKMMQDSSHSDSK